MELKKVNWPFYSYTAESILKEDLVDVNASCGHLKEAVISCTKTVTFRGTVNGCISSGVPELQALKEERNEVRRQV